MKHSIIISCLAFIISVNAESVTTNSYTWTYKVLNGGLVTLGNGADPAVTPVPIGEVVLPSELASYPVTGIGGYAFAGCEGISCLTIPRNVKNIGIGAFERCSGLTNLVIESTILSFDVPYLMQAKFGTRFDITSTLDNVTDARPVSGVIAAYTYVNEENAPWEFSDPLTGNVFAWNQKNSTFAYFGQMYMDAGKTYVFGTHFDDDAYVKIDGRVLVSIQSVKDSASACIYIGSFSCTKSGWYDVDIRLSDRTGSKGSWAHIWSADFGAGYRDDGITDTTQSEWSRLLDPGDGSLFRYQGIRTVFAGCSNIVSVTMPWSLVTNTAIMFPDAYKKLKSMTLTGTGGIIEIPAHAFSGCTNLTRVSLPHDVKTLTIGKGAFEQVTGIEITDMNGYVPEWTNEVGEVISDPFHQDTSITVAPRWPRVSVPVITPAEGNIFLNVSQTVTMAHESEGTIILYTTDGSDPATNGIEYNEPFIVYESCTVRAIARKDGLMDSEEVSIVLTRADGLGEAANLYGYLMETDENKPWTVVTDVSHDGVSCVRSGTIGHGGMTWLQTSVRKAGTVSFWWKAACEEVEVEDGETYWYDYGSFLVDGTVKAQIAGNDTGWQFVSVDVLSGGKHTLRWEYTKDDATTYSPDCIWLDQVQWIPADGSGHTLTTPDPVPYSWLSGYGLGFDSDFESAAKQSIGKQSGNGRAWQVWQDYVAGTDPTNLTSVFTASIEMKDGEPLVTWSPNLNSNGEVRVYTVMGKEKLTDAVWQSPTNSTHRFFKVKVELP